MDDEQIFEGPFFRLRYPSQWDVEVIEDVAAFFDPEGAGAVQVACSVKSPPIDLAEEMKSYLARQGIDYHEESMAFYENGAAQAVACEFVKQERFWMVTLLASRDRLIIVLYNADEVPGAETAEMILALIRSVELV